MSVPGPSEPAVFRPPVRSVGKELLLGAIAGAGVGWVAGIPPVLAALFGATAAAITVTALHARGLRVAAGETGLRVLGKSDGLDGPWGELRLGFGLAQRDDGLVQRYAVLADARGRSFAFGETGGVRCGSVRGADGAKVEVVDLREAPLLLALAVQRVPQWDVLPEPLRAAPAVTPASPGSSTLAAPGERRPRRAARLGVWAVLAKLGVKLVGSAGKVGAGALKAAKTANVGWAVASAATYSLLFSWKFALAIMVQLFVHEYGHVHAMRRTGMKVRGMFFVPLLGAIAVTDDAFTSRRQQVYVALNGPVWGSALALLPVALWWWTGDPLWATVAAWWALVNLFNLLPIAPLDGGRVLHAFAHSYSSGLGLALSVLGLAGAVALASALGFSLVWLVAALGAMELAAEAQSMAGVRALRLLPEPARLGVPHWLFLRALVGAPADARGEATFLRQLERQERAARAVPLRPAELARWGLAYAALAAALVLLIWAMRHVPGAEAASHVLE